MDLVIKNLEKLQDYHSKGSKHPIEKLVLDLDKLSETEAFTKIFEKSCDKYAEVGESYLVPNKDIKEVLESAKVCVNCKYCEIDSTQEPCRSCWRSMENRPNWEAKEPSLKEATEHMQSEFDVTGKDVRIFMENKKSTPMIPSVEPQKMKYEGFNSHDCEGWYSCPVCKKQYGDWGFCTNKIHRTFYCDKCGTELLNPTFVN